MSILVSSRPPLSVSDCFERTVTVQLSSFAWKGVLPEFFRFLRIVKDRLDTLQILSAVVTGSKEANDEFLRHLTRQFDSNPFLLSVKTLVIDSSMRISLRPFPSLQHLVVVGRPRGFKDLFSETSFGWVHWFISVNTKVQTVTMKFTSTDLEDPVARQLRKMTTSQLCKLILTFYTTSFWQVLPSTTTLPYKFQYHSSISHSLRPDLSPSRGCPRKCLRTCAD